MKSLFTIIKKPLLSEKGAQLMESANVYAFEVHTQATRTDVKQAVEKLFKVKVKSVNTMIVHGEYRRLGKGVTKRNNWKKALVTLDQGQKIELFQGA
jgi:large subunit ribosomal protein L23